MIEVEKKFLLESPDDERRLLEGATFLGEKKYRDTYYDDATYTLTTSNRWLRDRDGVWEMKIPLPNTTRDEDWVNQYDERAGEEAMRDTLNILKNNNLKSDLAARGIKPFCSFVTHRTSYKRDPFIIDIDMMDYGFRVAEVEYMVETKGDVDAAAKKIIQFAKERALSPTPVRGKCIEWLRRNNPAHLEALNRAGIIHI